MRRKNIVSDDQIAMPFFEEKEQVVHELPPRPEHDIVPGFEGILLDDNVELVDPGQISAMHESVGLIGIISRNAHIDSDSARNRVKVAAFKSGKSVQEYIDGAIRHQESASRRLLPAFKIALGKRATDENIDVDTLFADFVTKYGGADGAKPREKLKRAIKRKAKDYGVELRKVH